MQARVCLGLNQNLETALLLVIDEHASGVTQQLWACLVGSRDSATRLKLQSDL